MAILPDMQPVVWEPNGFLNEAAEAGVIAFYKSNVGSGEGIGDSRQELTVTATPSGLTPAGALIENFVNIDTSMYHVNMNKQDRPLGANAGLISEGWFVTNKINGTPANGSVAYAGPSGVIHVTVDAVGGTAATPKIGKFLTKKDENGYAKVYVKLPVVE